MSPERIIGESKAHRAYPGYVAPGPQSLAFVFLDPAELACRYYTMAAPPSYLLMPNFEYKPDGGLKKAQQQTRIKYPEWMR